MGKWLDWFTDSTIYCSRDCSYTKCTLHKNNIKSKNTKMLKVRDPKEPIAKINEYKNKILFLYE